MKNIFFHAVDIRIIDHIGECIPDVIDKFNREMKFINRAEVRNLIFVFIKEPIIHDQMNTRDRITRYNTLIAAFRNEFVQPITCHFIMTEQFYHAHDTRYVVEGLDINNVILLPFFEMVELERCNANPHGINQHWNSNAVKFSFLTGKPQWRIQTLYTVLTNDRIREKCEWSMFVHDDKCVTECTEILRNANIDVTESDVREFAKSYNRQVDDVDVIFQTGSTHSYGHPFDPSFFSNMLFSIVSETAAELGCSMMLTEKTYRHYINHVPVIHIGGANAIKNVKNAGYRTYDYLYPETFDVNNDSVTRHNIVEIIDSWFEKIPNNLDQIREDVEYNANRVFTVHNSGHEIMQQFFKRINSNIPLELALSIDKNFHHNAHNRTRGVLALNRLLPDSHTIEPSHTIYIYDNTPRKEGVLHTLTDIFKNIPFVNIDYLSNKPHNTDQPYTVFLEYGAFVGNKECEFLTNIVNADLQLSDAVWEDSGNGLVNWIVYYPVEAHIVFDYYKRMIYTLNVRHGDQILYLTAGETVDRSHDNIPAVKYINNKYGVNVACVNRLIGFIGVNPQKAYEHFNKVSLSILKKQLREYKGLNYNRVMRMHRIALLARLYQDDLAKDTIHSFVCSTDTVPWNIIDAYISSDGLVHYDLVPLHHKGWEEGYKTIHEIASTGVDINPHGLDLENNQAHRLSQYDASNSYLHIVSETVPYGTTELTEFEDDIVESNMVFITEKSFKPFLHMQPFIINGNYHAVHTLREYGFRTFDRWIDHSYDNIEVMADRFDAMYIELTRLYRLSAEEWSEMYYEMYDDLVYNFNHFIEMYSNHSPYKQQTQSAIIKFLFNKQI